ncbi:MAG TPA: M50 family metallopeptidase, partial [Actinomycetes bacterium]|nr:M50 family metallopeptidase [Actinomycetes bacterium]
MTRWLGRGVGLGRMLGIPVRLDLSLIAGLGVVVALSRELWAPAVTGPAALGWSGLFAVAFFGCVLAHELAHAVVARAVGVPTTEIRLFVFGGVATIAGEPAAPSDEALVALAGPLTSATLAGLLALASTTVAGPPGDLLAWLFAGNLVVAGFNLLPGFPLDGGRV